MISTAGQNALGKLELELLDFIFLWWRACYRGSSDQDIHIYVPRQACRLFAQLQATQFTAGDGAEESEVG